MVLSRPVTVKKKSQPIHVLHCNKVRKVIALCAAAAATAVVSSGGSDENEPMHTSWQTGQCWIDELLEGHPDRFRCAFGMSHHVFLKLIRVFLLKCGRTHQTCPVRNSLQYSFALP
ncbi:hypothetical protein B0H19DRAFT_1328220 [Mycena capillaripes]|nr:hypothetical protein B0H19DRAFT_1328220 [Mycena capillaripes]